MKRALLALLLILGICRIEALAADKIDARLAKVSKAWIALAEPGEDGRAVAACLIDRLPANTKLTVVDTREEADVVLKVKAHIPGAGSRYALGMMGGTPSANLEASLPDGTKLWSDGAKNRAGTGGVIGAVRKEDSIACGLADRLSNTLQTAIRKARLTQ